jgi:hypothetical protein
MNETLKRRGKQALVLLFVLSMVVTPIAYVI